MAEATRRIVYVGTADKVDMRPAVGYALTDESPDATKFIFYPRTSKIDPTAGLRQLAGVEVTEEQALQLLTSPFVVGGFVDVTTEEPPAAEELASAQVPARLQPPTAVEEPHLVRVRRSTSILPGSDQP